MGMNLAEGSAKRTNAHFALYVETALGSARELGYQLLLARDLGYLSESDFQHLEPEDSRLQPMLTGLLKSLGHTALLSSYPTPRLSLHRPPTTDH
jgi:four helix bundle protein